MSAAARNMLNKLFDVSYGTKATQRTFILGAVAASSVLAFAHYATFSKDNGAKARLKDAIDSELARNLSTAK